MAKKMGLWARGDKFAAKHRDALRNDPTTGMIHEYLRFAYMQGYMARQRDERRRGHNG